MPEPQAKPVDCFHCGLPVPAGCDYSVEIDGAAQAMCCPGCQAVAQAIVANDLTDFYRLRTEKGNRPEDLIPDALRELQVYDAEELQRSFVRLSDAGDVREADLILEGITCAACVWLNEHHVQQLAGVLDFRVNYSTHRATLRWDNSELPLSAVLKAITDIGYYAHPFDPGRLQNLQKKEKSAALRRIAVAGLGMMQVMMVAVALYIGEAADMSVGMQQFLRWMSLLMATPVVLYSARVFFIAAWRDVQRRRLGMDVPVALAIGIAYVASIWATWTGTGDVYFDSVTMFTFFLLTGRYLEMAARHKSGQIAEELVRLMPATATRLSADGQQSTVPVSDLQAGDEVLIRPGETVPADGRVTRGHSHIDEALLTGESLPRPRQVGDKLVGGTLNRDSPLVMQVDKVGEQTTLAAITRLLERAQTEKPRLAQLADRVASWFVVVILIVAVAVFAFWHGRAPDDAFWITLSVLVVTCPCALSLATPVALTAATSLLTSQGVLITRGPALETLAKVSRMVFDKTGTLTQGILQVVAVEPLADVARADCSRLAASLEQSSEHPIAQALVALAPQAATMQAVTATAGCGVQGTWEGEVYRVGTAAFVAELVGQAPPVMQAEAGYSLVYLGRAGQYLAVFTLADEMRSTAPQALKTLQDRGLKISLLSGDHPKVVQRLADRLGMACANTQGACLPADKWRRVQAYQAEGDIVAMVGDGVNDAPVLAGADVSIAMGSGSQLAQASADMVLLSENLEHLPFAVLMACKTQQVIYQNFAWAIAYNIVALPLAASGFLPPWAAALGMSASSLVVVLNALRLRGRIA